MLDIQHPVMKPAPEFKGFGLVHKAVDFGALANTASSHTDVAD